MYPEELLYTKSNIWVTMKNDHTATIGITDFAQHKLGKIIFVDFPDLDSEYDQFDPIIVIEAEESMKEVYAPLSGRIVRINEEIDDDPTIINHEPYEDGWILEMEISNENEMINLLDYEQYVKMMELEEFDE